MNRKTGWFQYTQNNIRERLYTYVGMEVSFDMVAEVNVGSQQVVLMHAWGQQGDNLDCPLWEQRALVVASLNLQTDNSKELSYNAKYHTLNLYKTIPGFTDSGEEGQRKHCGKRRKCWLPAFSPFPTNVFYPVRDKYHHFSHV